MHAVSVFFADTVNAKVRQTPTMTSIILASPCGDRETESFNDWGDRGCRKFVPVLKGDGTKIAPP